MKLVMKTTLAAADGTVAVPGQTVDFDAKRAKALLDGGYAVPAEGEKTPPRRRQSSGGAGGGKQADDAGKTTGDKDRGVGDGAGDKA